MCVIGSVMNDSDLLHGQISNLYLLWVLRWSEVKKNVAWWHDGYGIELQISSLPVQSQPFCCHTAFMHVVPT